MPSNEKRFNKNILIAVDESENARRAVIYVGRLLGGIEWFRALILHIIRQPDEDFFPNPSERDKWLADYRLKVDAMLEDYRTILIDSGFAPTAVSVRSMLRHCPSLAECILSELHQTQYHTIVVGRQGLSRSEAFLFGSVSSKIVNHARDCTVWVVE
jgi:nucleotide-binding universal stress UspA family protein